MGLRRDSRPHKLLQALGIGVGVITISLLAPTAAAVVIQKLLKQYFRGKRFEREWFLRDVKHLQSRELVDFRDLGHGEIKITITRAGKKKVLQYELDSMRLDTSKPWDGKWRLIIFDIPHSHKQGRDAFSGKLCDLKFYRIQKSVFITPYSCEKEINFVASIFGVQEYIVIMYVEHFEGQEKVARYFGL